MTARAHETSGDHAGTLEKDSDTIVERLTELKVKRGRLFHQLCDQMQPDMTSLFMIERIRRIDELIEFLEAKLKI